MVSGTDAEQPEMQLWPAARTVARFSRATKHTSKKELKDKDRIAGLDLSRGASRVNWWRRSFGKRWKVADETVLGLSSIIISDSQRPGRPAAAAGRRRRHGK